MEKISFTVAAVVFFSNTIFSQTWIRPEDAKYHKGEVIGTIGYVSEVKPMKNRNVTSTRVILKSGDFKHAIILIVPSTEPLKQAELRNYLNQYVQVNGLVAIEKGKPMITLHRASQISIVRESWPEEE